MTTHALLSAQFKTDPYLHQWLEFERSAEAKSRALIWQMRTGKSKLTVDTACHLFLAGLIDAVLVLAPNGVHENWVRRELPIHLWECIKYRALSWRTDIAGKKGIKRVAAGERQTWTDTHEEFWLQAADMLKDKKTMCWFSFNSESMTRDDVRKLVARISRNRRVLVIFDESHDYRQPGSKRTKMARALAGKCAYRRILSGTPILNSPLHAYSQFELLEKGALGFPDFEAFKAKFAEYKLEKNWKTGKSYPKLDGYINMELLRERMAPWSSVVLRGDCQDMPDLVRTVREVELSDEQVRLYRELVSAFEVELEDGKLVSIGEQTNRLMKLQQVVNGFLIDEFKGVHLLSENPRLDHLIDEVYLTPGKFIVWCAFQWDMDIVAKALRERGYKILEYHGRTSPDDKRRAREAFAPGADSDIDGLVGHPKSGGSGLDLSDAGKIIWYSGTPDAIVVNQADERATAVGGKNVPIVSLRAPGVDYYWADIVENKRLLSDDVAGNGLKAVLNRIKI